MKPAPQDCRSAWRNMQRACSEAPVRNYVQVLDMSDYLVETELFPAAALHAYSAFNMEKAIGDAERQFISAQRGGPQGDYRDGMAGKIANAIDCLTQFPQSKRAVITVSNRPAADHRNDADAKCVRELHLYLDEDDRLSGTVFLRAQAVSLFPKNIHMLGSIMSEVAAALPQRPALGSLFYLASILVRDRN